MGVRVDLQPTDIKQSRPVAYDKLTTGHVGCRPPVDGGKQRAHSKSIGAMNNIDPTRTNSKFPS